MPTSLLRKARHSQAGIKTQILLASHRNDENQRTIANHMNSEIHILCVSLECIGIQSENASQDKYETHLDIVNHGTYETHHRDVRVIIALGTHVTDANQTLFGTQGVNVRKNQTYDETHLRSVS